MRAFWANFKKRWLHYLGELFVVIIPLVLIIEAVVRVDYGEKHVYLQVGGFILGCLYLAFLSKKTRAKVIEMKAGPFRTLLIGLLDIIPYITAGLLVYLAEHIFTGFENNILMICASMLIGTILKAIEEAINKDYLYNLHITELAKEQAAIERKKAELLADK